MVHKFSYLRVAVTKNDRSRCFTLHYNLLICAIFEFIQAMVVSLYCSAVKNILKIHEVRVMMQKCLKSENFTTFAAAGIKMPFEPRPLRSSDFLPPPPKVLIQQLYL